MSKSENILTNVEKRLFYLSDDIDNTSIGRMCFDLIFLLQEDNERESKEVGYERQPIKIYINSFGGSVYDMWSLIDIILNSKTPIYTYCTGYAMSSAFNIFLAGHKKFATQHSTFMYHQIYCYRNGKYQDLVEDRDEMDWINNTVENYVIERTKLTQDDLNNIREKKQDFYIHANDALKYGIIDEIILN